MADTATATPPAPAATADTADPFWDEMSVVQGFLTCRGLDLGFDARDPEEEADDREQEEEDDGIDDGDHNKDSQFFAEEESLDIAVKVLSDYYPLYNGGAAAASEEEELVSGIERKRTFGYVPKTRLLQRVVALKRNRATPVAVATDTAAAAAAAKSGGGGFLKRKRGGAAASKTKSARRNPDEGIYVFEAKSR